MGYAYVKGLQSGKVAAMVKHFVRPPISGQGKARIPNNERRRALQAQSKVSTPHPFMAARVSSALPIYLPSSERSSMPELSQSCPHIIATTESPQ